MKGGNSKKKLIGKIIFILVGIAVGIYVFAPQLIPEPLRTVLGKETLDPINCEHENDWTPLCTDADCGQEIIQNRKRTVLAEHGGIDCSPEDLERRINCPACSPDPINCVPADEWDKSCDDHCGENIIQKRGRKIEAQYGGNDCAVDDLERQIQCPVCSEPPTESTSEDLVTDVPSEELEQVETQSTELVFDGDFNNITDQEQYLNDVKSDLATTLGVDSESIVIESINDGSIKIKFLITSKLKPEKIKEKIQNTNSEVLKKGRVGEMRRKMTKDKIVRKPLRDMISSWRERRNGTPSSNAADAATTTEKTNMNTPDPIEEDTPDPVEELEVPSTHEPVPVDSLQDFNYISECFAGATSTKGLLNPEMTLCSLDNKFDNLKDLQDCSDEVAPPCKIPNSVISFGEDNILYKNDNDFSKIYENNSHSSRIRFNNVKIFKQIFYDNTFADINKNKKIRLGIDFKNKYLIGTFGYTPSESKNYGAQIAFKTPKVQMIPHFRYIFSFLAKIIKQKNSDNVYKPNYVIIKNADGKGNVVNFNKRSVPDLSKDEWNKYIFEYRNKDFTSKNAHFEIHLQNEEKQDSNNIFLGPRMDIIGDQVAFKDFVFDIVLENPCKNVNCNENQMCVNGKCVSQ